MPRAPKPRAYDWVAENDDDRRGPQGRPRSGPRGVAVRELPRVTVRAPGRVLARWEAILEVQGLAAHDAFAAVTDAYMTLLDATTTAKITARARAIRRERFGEVP